MCNEPMAFDRSTCTKANVPSWFFPEDYRLSIYVIVPVARGAKILTTFLVARGTMSDCLNIALVDGVGYVVLELLCCPTAQHTMDMFVYRGVEALG